MGYIPGQRRRRVQVTYKNVTRVFFRAVPFDAEEAIQPVWRSISRDELEMLLTIEPVLQWDADLPATEDYQQRTETLPAPEGLEKGFYFIIASHDPSFDKSDNKVSVARIWVSDLALVVRTLHGDGVVEGFVLGAGSGEPLADAIVARWTYDRTSKLYRLTDQTRSDENGLFGFSRVDPDRFVIV
ncbi:MAG: hypothetical protein ACYTAO_08475, partial [Planctomycetota bacterium]